MTLDTIEIFGIKINKLTNSDFLELFGDAIKNKHKITIGYANAHTLNSGYKSRLLADLLNSMDYIHPDGIGVYLASQHLFGKLGLKNRITGSDFYPLLIDECIKNGWSLFFFGHKSHTLEKIRLLHPTLNIAGMAEGYDYDSAKVIEQINSSQADILIIGLSFPLQEKWIHEFKDKLECNVILAVGDGIKVFSGEKKRGPMIFRKLGLEWLIRVIVDPFGNMERYLIGNPKFIARVLRERKREN